MFTLKCTRKIYENGKMVIRLSPNESGLSGDIFVELPPSTPGIIEGVTTFDVSEHVEPEPVTE